MTYDFSGYATRHNVRCSDGRMIMPDAFKDCDGQIVPLVWQHVHDTPDNVLGHAELENRPDGVYAYCSLNNTKSAENAKELVQHGDICALSIYANRLQQVGSNVMHGVIREVSLVLAGANPGATIDNLAFAHSDGTTEVVDTEACIYYVDENSALMHADEDVEEEDVKDTPKEKTIGEIIDTMNEEQKQALYAIVGSLSEEKEGEDSEGIEEDEPKKPSNKSSLQHAVKPSEDEEADSSVDGGNVEEVLDTLDEDQSDALQQILKSVKTGKAVSKDVADVFDTFDNKQKDAVYFLVGALMDDDDEEDDGENLSHADDDEGETIKDVLSDMTDEQTEAVEQILEAIGNGSDKVPEEVANVFNGLDEKHKDAVYALVGLALEQDGNEEGEEGGDAEEDDTVKHYDNGGETMTKYNVFENDESMSLSHADVEGIFIDAPRVGSLKETVLEHGITDIEVLFPEAQAVNREPYMLSRRMEWVSTVLNGVHKSPFARIKSTAANLTEEQARAKGYIKGRKKIEEQITALRRITTPQTVYKLQKLDRDDIVDITDFDVVAWMKNEMRMMLDEELARAILVGDGRLMSDPEKILPDHIRPVWSDDEMYTIHQVIATANATDYTQIMDDVIRARKGYKGSGNPVMFIGPDMLTEMRLLKDQDNRLRYDSDQKLAEAMRVSKIEEVELFDDLVRTVNGKDRKLVAIILNLADYTLGADKGGEVTMFDDFDIDFNKMSYLIETRVSGALTMPKSAIAIEIQTVTDSQADPIYVKVTSPVTADIDDYYEQDEYGRYIKTVDVAVVTGKTYYEVQE